MTNSWDEIIDKFISKFLLFEDERYLDVSSPILCEILHRQEEIAQLMILFSSLIKNSRSVNQFIYGEPGTGKTATIRFFASALMRCAEKHRVLIKYCHINCRQTKTEYQTIIDILSALSPNFPKLGHSLEFLISALKNLLNKTRMQLLLVLDDMDSLLERDADILYHLTRLNDGSGENPRISIIGIVRNISVIKNVYKKIGSFFQKNVIEFKPYTSEQLFDILKAKAEKCFRCGVVSDELIQYAVSLSSDVRHCMNILWCAGKIAQGQECRKITKEHIDLANKEVPFTNLSENIKDLNIDKLIFLRAIAKVLSLNQKTTTTLKEIQPVYNELCVKNKKIPKSNSQIWHYVQEFKRENILDVVVESGTSRGRRSVVEIDSESLLNLEEIIERLMEVAEP